MQYNSICVTAFQTVEAVGSLPELYLLPPLLHSPPSLHTTLRPAYIDLLGRSALCCILQVQLHPSIMFY